MAGTKHAGDGGQQAAMSRDDTVVEASRRIRIRELVYNREDSSVKFRGLLLAKAPLAARALLT